MKNKKNKKHIEYIDMARGFGICAIVYSHFTNIVSVLKPDLSTSLGIRCLSLFHIPIFFIVRGQVLAYRGEMELNKKFLSKRVRDLIVPYIFFCMLYTTYVYVDMTIHHIPNAMVEVQRNLLHTFTFYGVSVLWFLPMMFLGELWYVILKNKVNKTIVSVMICTLMLVTYIVSPYLEVTSKRCFWMQSMGLLILNYILVVFFRSFLALFYIWLGYQSVSIFQKLNGKVKKEIIGVAILLGVGIIFLPYTQTIEIHYLKLGKRIYSFISTICFSFGFCFCFRLWKINL